MTFQYSIKGVYSFDVYPTALLGNDWTKTTVMAVMDYETAKQFADVDALHVSVYPYLPVGTPDDPSQYDYLKVRTQSGVVTYLGRTWVNESSITAVDSVVIVAVIDNVSSANLNDVRNALVSNGFTSITLSTQVPSTTS